MWARLLRLAGAHAGAEVDRRQTEARSDHEGRRAYASTIAGDRSQRRHQTGPAERCAARVLVSPNAGPQAPHAGGGRLGQQDRPHRLGLDGQRWDLPSSSDGGVTLNHRCETSGRRTDEGGYGAQSARRDRENQRFPPCLSSTPWVIWTRSANSHTGQHRPGGAQQAGQMAASDYATVTSSNPLLRRRGRPQMESGLRPRVTL